MGFKWNPDNQMTTINKGVDFCLFFNCRTFSALDIAERYNVTRRQAYRIIKQAMLSLDIKPAGFGGEKNDLYLWRFNL